ncbi:MAG: DEAD/DEAH box helicase [Halobacteria archaeon]
MSRNQQVTSDQEVTYVSHPLLEDEVIEERMYQLELSSAALSEDTLVVLPTSAGKTTVSLLSTAARLKNYGGKSLFLAPTKPLVEQHAGFYREALDIPEDEIKVFTGEIRPDNRAEVWDDARVVIATPQVVENDLLGNRFSLDDVVHLTFDECHRATGDYAYNYIAERYHVESDQPLVTGMTASPGSDKEAILEVCENLGISNFEIITENNPSLAKYSHETEVDWRNIEVPDDVLEIRDHLNDVIGERMDRLHDIGVVDSSKVDMSMKKLLNARGRIQNLMDDGESQGYEAMSLHAEVMKLRHAVKIIETQGVDPLVSYFEKLENEAGGSGGSKAVKRLMSDTRVQKARYKAEEYDDLHPKMDVMRSSVIGALGEGAERVIVFTEYRDTASTLVEFLEKHDGIDPVRFVGQSSKDGDSGLTQKQQGEVLDSFRRGDHNVLVATSVAEEGLDIPEVDLVLFYEPVPSAIRSIQRRGRTGRERAGNCVVLVAEDTRDEAFFWSSKRKEDRMKEEMRDLKNAEKEINEELEPDDDQRSLGDFDDEEEGEEDTEEEDVLNVVVDQRETKSNVARSLDGMENVELSLDTLEVGDFVVSDRVAVERKSMDDLISTLTGDRSMFEQVGELSRNYSKPLLILEGEPEELFSTGVHPNAVRGALASLTTDFEVPVIYSRDEDETAEYLSILAEREQKEEDRVVRVHGEKSSATLPEQQEYVVSSISDVGIVTARSLLNELGSVENVVLADKEELMEADGVGEKTAEKIRQVVESKYGK